MTPFYTMVSAYNGQLYKLNIYSKKIDDLIGPFNLETGEENQFITLSNGSKIYYEKTNSKNFTEIITPVKKLNKNKFISAVNSQLLYLSNVRFYIVDESKNRIEHHFKARVKYNSENIIISDNSQYSRPHLVVVKDKTSTTGICYNEINYKELELEQRFGHIGLKVQMRSVGKDENGNEYLINDGVTVTPNREQVIWNDDTKAYLLSITRKVAEEAAEIINTELIEEDFLEWIGKAAQALSSVSYGSTLYELSQMIDKSNIVPAYCKDKTIKFKSCDEMFWGFYPRFVRYESQYIKSTGTSIKKIARDVVEGWRSIVGKNVYIKYSDERVSNVKDQYLIQSNESNKHGFVIIEFDDLDKKLEELLEKTAPEKKEEIEDKFNKKREKFGRILKYIEDSSLSFNYDDVVVPDDFKATAEEEEAKVEEVLRKEEASLEEIRKANGEIVFFTCRTGSSYLERDELFWDKIEEKITAITLWGDCKIFYGFQEDSDMIKNACRISGNDETHWFNRDIRIVKISRKNEKHFKQVGTHISNFFSKIDGGTITMDDDVKKYLTARYVCKRVTENHDLDFFGNNERIDPRLSSIYKSLVKYSENFSKTLKLRTTEEVERQQLEYLIKCAEFQIFVSESAENVEWIKAKSQELFGTELLRDASALDMRIIKQANLLTEYSEPVKEMFNQMRCFVPVRSYDSTDEFFSSKVERLVRVILKETCLDKFEIPEELLEINEEKVAEEE